MAFCFAFSVSCHPLFQRRKHQGIIILCLVCLQPEGLTRVMALWWLNHVWLNEDIGFVFSIIKRIEGTVAIHWRCSGGAVGRSNASQAARWLESYRADCYCGVAAPLKRGHRWRPANILVASRVDLNVWLWEKNLPPTPTPIDPPHSSLIYSFFPNANALSVR